MDSLGAFTECMVDGDPESVRRECQRRRVGLAVSVTFQMGVLAALVLVPLMSKAVLPMIRVNQIPLLEVPRPVEIVPAQPAHPAPRQGVFPAPPTNSAPVAHHDSPRSIGTGIDIGPIDDSPTGGEEVLGETTAPKPPEMPAARQPDRPVVRGGKVMEALLVNRIEPGYPAVAKATRTSGDVVLNAIIGTDGTIQSINVVSGNPLLIKAAKDAVSQWRYKPTLLNGEPVEVETLITVKFILQD